jgi:hypothetical protein
MTTPIRGNDTAAPSLTPAWMLSQRMVAGFRSALGSSQPFFHPVLLSAPQWAALALVPVLSFAVGLIWLARGEGMLLRLAAGPGAAQAAPGR